MEINQDKSIITEQTWDSPAIVFLFPELSLCSSACRSWKRTQDSSDVSYTRLDSSSFLHIMPIFLSNMHLAFVNQRWYPQYFSNNQKPSCQSDLHGYRSRSDKYKYPRERNRSGSVTQRQRQFFLADQYTDNILLHICFL